jgi:hypothetical protein
VPFPVDAFAIGDKTVRLWRVLMWAHGSSASSWFWRKA